MAVFRVEKNSGYTVMSNHHLRNRALSLKAKGLLSQMLSLPEDWDHTLQGLARINRESIDAIRQAIRELEQAGYIQRSRERDEKGRLRGADYVIFELPQPVPASVSPTLENPTLENPTQENPTLENPMQLNKDMGFQTGNILEPSMGVGNFFGMLPESMKSSRLYGVELDSITGRIAKQLYPKADITVAGFETTDRKDFYDLAVGNVPFGQYQVSDRAFDKLGFSI